MSKPNSQFWVRGNVGAEKNCGWCKHIIAVFHTEGEAYHHALMELRPHWRGGRLTITGESERSGYYPPTINHLDHIEWGDCCGAIPVSAQQRVLSSA
jgi:hypothetical protein